MIATDPRAAVESFCEISRTAVAQLPMAMAKSPNEEGIQSDWSYHYHGKGINLGYGKSDVSARTKWLYLLHDTPWQIPPFLQNEYIAFIREFYRHNFWKGRISPYAFDRGIAMPEGIWGRGAFEDFSLALLGGFPAEDRDSAGASVANR